MIGSSSSPTEKLHVVGDALITGDSHADAFKPAVSGNPIKFKNFGSTELARITDGGNVGIGTSSPSHKLTISSSNDTTAVGIDIGSSANFDFAANSSSGYSTLFYMDDVGLDIGHNSTSRALNFKTGSTDRLTITGGGNVLIGTTTDSGAKLNVQGSLQVGVDDTGYDVTFYGDTSGEYLQWDASQNRLEFKDNVSAIFGGSNDLKIFHNGNHSFISQEGTGSLFIRSTSDGQDIVFQSDNGTGGTVDYITLDGSQTTINLQKNVLIGTTTNSGIYKIDVAGKQRVQSVLELDDVLTLNQISTPVDPASGKSSIYMDSADGAIKVKINVGGTVVTRTIASFE